jgi:hypothetical protein
MLCIRNDTDNEESPKPSEVEDETDDDEEFPDPSEDEDEADETVIIPPTLHPLQDPSLDGDTPAQPVAPYPCTPKEYKIEPFPSEHASAPFQPALAVHSDYVRYRSQLNGDNDYAPFMNKLDWEIARWAKIHGPSSAAVTELLQIEGVSDTKL